MDVFFQDNKYGLDHVTHTKHFFRPFQAPMICFVVTMVRYAIREFETGKQRAKHLSGEIPDGIQILHRAVNHANFFLLSLKLISAQ